jgi:hypothetical protein
MSDIRNAIEFNALEGRVLQVTTALYRVTDLYSDSEPIKWMLRKDAIDFACYINNSVIANESSVLSDDLQRARNICRMLQQKLAVLKATGYISRINIKVLEDEYATLLETIHVFIKDMSFTISPMVIKDISKSHIPDNASPIVETSAVKNVGKKSSREPSSTIERQEAIKNILRGREWLSVVEVTSLHKGGVSAKTVQRDLNTLLEKGVIRSKGERRWRKYMLVK